MGNRSEYTIELNIENGDKTRSTVDAIERGLKSISDASKRGDLSKGMADAKKAAEGLETQLRGIVTGSEDATAEMKAFDRASTKAIADLEKQATALNHALSEQGKQQRARIAEIESELKALGKTAAEKAKKKQLETELKALQKDVVQGSDEELESALKENKAIRARLKLTQQEAKLLTAQRKDSKTLGQLVKADLQALKEKIRLQTQFISQLRTTEGRYKAIKKAAGTIGAGAMKAAKGIGLGVGGALMAIGGAAVAGANDQVTREREAGRIRASLSDEEKKTILGEIYMASGADYSSIVDAINRVVSVLGNTSKDELTQAAIAEVRFPGAAAMYRQQNVGKVTAADFSQYAGKMRAIQGATGATVDQITQSTDKIANLRQSAFSNASMTELQSLYLALQNSGAYDNQEELDTAFRRFVHAQKGSGKSVFDFAAGFDWEKTAYGRTNRQQVATAIGNLDWGRLASAASSTGGIQETDAEQTARKMRELEVRKNQILSKMLEALAPVIEAIDVKELSTFFDAMIRLAKDISPVISKIVSFATDTLAKLVQIIETLYEWVKDSAFGQYIAENIPAFANGGVTSMPSLVGERGPEAVIPLSYDRSARAGNIMQTISQTFNMQGNETTTLSLSKAVNSRGFQRAMGNMAYLNNRLGR